MNHIIIKSTILGLYENQIINSNLNNWKNVEFSGKLLVDVKKLYSFNNLRIGTLVDQAFSEQSKYYKALK